MVEGVDLSKLMPDAEYTIRQLTEVFPLSVQALRKAVKDGALKARKKGKFWLVRGIEAKKWWNQD